jgi:transcriptional regulator with XRE-family HTH domain
VNPNRDVRRELLTQPGGLAERLRALRVKAGLNGKELAERLGWAQSKVSRLESGRQSPSPADLDAWVRKCNATAETAQELMHLLTEVDSAHRDWRRRMAGGQAPVQADYRQMIADASRIRFFETAWVPGLLQTPEYAHRVFTEMATLHGARDVDAAVAQRMDTQRFLYDTGKQFEFLIDEAVLRRRICPPPIMVAQFDRFFATMGMSNVRFGVLPFDVELAVTPAHGFQICDEVACVEAVFDEAVYWDRPEMAARYGEVLDRLWTYAAEGDDARRLIVAAVEALPHV